MISKHRLEQLYTRKGESMKSIAKMLGCSTNRVQYWLERHGIPTRTRSEASYLKWNPDGDPFLVKKLRSRRDFVLMGLGLGLWWGEGYKKHPKTIRLGNTDPELIKAFIAFLTDICGMRPEKIRYGLQVFSDMKPDVVRKWWLTHLGVSAAQFLPKTVVTPARSIGTYREKTKYGVLTIYCSNVKLRKVMDILLETYAKSLIR